MATKKPKKKPAKSNKARLFFLTLGELALDVAKLGFAGVVLGGIMRVDIPEQTLISTGLTISGIVALVGIICVILCKEK